MSRPTARELAASIGKKQYVLCRKTGKRGFRSIDTAQKALVTLMLAQEEIRKGETYRCKYCKRWHLSTWYPLKQKRTKLNEELTA